MTFRFIVNNPSNCAMLLGNNFVLLFILIRNKSQYGGVLNHLKEAKYGSGAHDFAQWASFISMQL